VVYFRHIMAAVFLAGLLSSPGYSADPEIGGLLERVGSSVERSWRELGTVSCTERLAQRKLKTGGKVVHRKDSTFDYLVLLKLHGTELTVEESRVLRGAKGKTKDDALLQTSGFSTLLLVFHPHYQDSFRYRLAGEELLASTPAVRVAFTHIPGTRSTSALRLGEQDYPLDFRGTAWVEPNGGRILRIEAGLVKPIIGLGLQLLSSDVRYQPVHLASTDEVYWLPSEARIEAKTTRQHWINVHSFSDYKRYSVKSEEGTAASSEHPAP